jgi:hypothetical protein
MLAFKKLVEEIKEGKTICEIVSETAPKEVEEMQCIETQMAIMSVIEKLGYTKQAEAVIIEQLSSHRMGFLNTLGSKALSSLIESTSYSTQEIMTYVEPSDFKPENVRRRIAQILNFAQQVNQAQVRNEC